MLGTTIRSTMPLYFENRRVYYMKFGVCTTVRSAGMVGSRLAAVLLENGVPERN